MEEKEIEEETKSMKGKILVFSIAAVVFIVAGVMIGRYFEMRRSAEQAAATEEIHSAQLTTIRGEATQWAGTLAGQQAEVVLRSFVSGITPSILAERRESVELSAVGLLRIPGVDGIHVLRPDGSVVYSSDGKLVSTGQAGEQGAWASAVTELASRPGARTGVVEIAMPITDSGKNLAVVWLEFGVDSVRDLARPAGLAATQAPRTGGQANELVVRS